MCFLSPTNIHHEIIESFTELFIELCQSCSKNTKNLTNSKSKDLFLTDESCGRFYFENNIQYENDPSTTTLLYPSVMIYCKNHCASGRN